jgi:hypothetical protein
MAIGAFSKANIRKLTEDQQQYFKKRQAKLEGSQQHQ